MDQTYLTLNNGTKIPQFGMGVYQVPEGEETKQACLFACIGAALSKGLNMLNRPKRGISKDE